MYSETFWLRTKGSSYFCTPLEDYIYVEFKKYLEGIAFIVMYWKITKLVD
jgi:hypothetical protein